ncbi:MAG: amino acid adenylation domain-containing protein [bacterium]|nr:amino acid adenylation domain-containing protein [bacterium]
MTSPAKQLTAEQLAGLSREQKLALLARLAGKRKSVPRASPLSFSQQRLWFLDRFDPGGYAHNIFRAVELEGALDRDALERALAEIVRRHAALRARFTEVDGEPRQIVAGADEAEELLRQSLIIVDLRAVPSAARRRQVRELAFEEASHAFDLERAPLLRVSLVRTGERSHTVLVTLHHIVADGWSLGLFFGELSELYRAFSAGEPSPLPPLPIQYTDFARWQQEELDLTPQLDHWRADLDGAPGVLDLPTDRLRPAVASARGAIHELSLSEPLHERLKTFARQARATPFMVLLAAFDALLYRYSDQKDFLIGTPIANRHRAEVEGLIGCFANTLVLRARLDRGVTFRQLVRQIRRRALDAYTHQDLPFERLVEELQPQRDPSRNPLFQVMFALLNTPAARLELPGLEVRPFHVERHLSKVDLTLEMFELGDRLEGYFEFNLDLFERATIGHLTEHFQVLLEALVTEPDRAISRQPWLTAAEHRRLVAVWSRGGGRKPVREPIHRLIARRAAQTPDAIAVIEPAAVASGFERCLSFRQLVDRARRLAAVLRRRGVGPESRVGISLDRSLEAVVAILGTLEAGAAYVFLDPTYPEERRAYMIADAGAELILTRESLTEVLSESAEDGAEGRPLALENAAYLVYTSGSTGQPKGVVVSHRAVSHHASAIARRYRLGDEDRVLQFASLSFDISVEEIFPTLLSGAALVLRPSTLSLTFTEFFRFMELHRLSVLNLPTPYWHEWVSELASGRLDLPTVLRLVVVGTEQALADRLRIWRDILHQRKARHRLGWINAYGPSEATVTTTVYGAQTLESRERARAEGGDETRGEHGGPQHVPIGRPIANVRTYLLNNHLAPVPPGVSGYLYLGGDSLARGYQGRPALTAEKFVPDPYGHEPGSRIYHTGDVSRWLADGNIEFLGRVDHQVKIRGFRIELGEVEAVLSGHPEVKESVVTAPEVAPGERRLAAYLVPESPLVSAPEAPAHEITEASRQMIDGVRAFADESLPHYMVPAAFVVLDHLPMTASGKVDRRALPEPSWTAAAHTGPFAAPRTPQEELLAEVWSTVLDLPREPGVDEDFFDLGGHSLLATRALARVRELLGVDVPIRVLFEAPTIAGLSERIDAERRIGSGTVPPPIRSRTAEGAPPTAAPPLSFAQQRMWFLDQLEPGSAAYNMPAALSLAGDLDVRALERSLREIVRRHDSLRTTFKSEAGRPTQTIQPPPAVELPVVEVEGQEAALELARRESLEPFDLTSGPLLRTVLLRIDEREHLLVFTMHHIVSDGWSIDVFLRDLVRIYDAFRRKRPSPLNELPVQYTDFARWQRRWLEGEVLDGQLAYWREQLAGAPSVLELPLDRPRPPVQSFRGARAPIRLSAEQGEQLHTLARRLGATPFMVLLAAFGMMLRRYSGQDDVSIGTPVAGRQRPELDDLIGFFVNTLVLRLDLGGDEDFKALVKQVRETALDAYTHQDVPFEQLVEELRPAREMSHNPLFQVLFVLHQARPGGRALEDLELDLPSIDNRTSRFDLTLSLSDTGEGLEGFLEYATDLFDAPTAERMAGYLERLLVAALAAPERRHTELSGLGASELHQLTAWNDTRVEYPETAPIHLLFADHAERHPDAVALIFEHQWLSYGELDRRVNQLAHYLRGLGVCRDRLVGVALERSVELVVSIYAILKAGGAYVPFDISYPRQRLSRMLEDSGIDILLSRRREASKLPLADAEEGLRVVDLDELRGEIGRCATAAPEIETDDEQLAYMIFTSGSTGRPKGVMNRHGSIRNRLLWMQQEYGLEAHDRVLQKTPFSFDVSAWELFWPLITGAQLVVARPEGHRDPAYLAELIARLGVTTVHFVPSMLNLFLEHPRLDGCDCLRRVIASGEALPPETCRTFHGRPELAGAGLHNLYGPTEAAVDVTYHRCLPEGEERGVPIGRPVANTEIHVLERLGPVPLGVAGELLIGGVQLARGYHLRPSLTAETFVPDPYGDRSGARLYRTGDLARHRPDGEVEFLGRLDHQVKIRGLRIELGEIEVALDEHPRVRECVVLARSDDGDGDPRLAAYVVPAEPVVLAEPVALAEPVGAVAGFTRHLRKHLGTSLPDYMVPADFVFLDVLPLGPNGKVDRKSLPAPERDRSSLGSTFVAPRTPIEEQLAGIWRQVLGREEIGVQDSFFDLGGHSLLAVQVRARMVEAFGVELPLRRMFEAPTVASLAEDLVEHEVADADQDLLADLLADLESSGEPTNTSGSEPVSSV